MKIIEKKAVQSLFLVTVRQQREPVFWKISSNLFKFGCVERTDDLAWAKVS